MKQVRSANSCLHIDWLESIGMKGSPDVGHIFNAGYPFGSYIGMFAGQQRNIQANLEGKKWNK